MGSARPLAEAYRQFAEGDDAGTSPLSARVALALSGSEDALRAIGTAPARARRPRAVLAALHDLALAGRAPALAAAYDDADADGGADADAAARAAVDLVLRAPDEVLAVAARRPVRTFQTRRCSALYPAVAEAVHRTGAATVGLIDVRGPAGLNLHVDRVGITYGNGQALGDPASAVQLSAALVGDRPLPGRAVPPVLARVGVGPDPVDLTDPDEARWVRACLRPEQREERAAIEAGIAVASADPAGVLRGDAVDVLPEAIASVPAGALPVVLTTWALSTLPVAGRQRFLRALAEAAADRPLAWVSLEGVGVAPAVPTLGDRPASGHSIIGLAVFEGPAPRVEAIGRCWSRGRFLSWLSG